MTLSLYTLHETPAPGEFIIQKFDTDYHCESVYACSLTSCMCPQGHKDRCRHRTMLPLFLKFGHIGDGWFLEWDTRQWRRPIYDIVIEPNPTLATYSEVEDELSTLTEEMVSRPSVGAEEQGSPAPSAPGEAPPGLSSQMPSPPPSPPEGPQPAPSAETAPVSPVVAGVPIVKRRKMS